MPNKVKKADLMKALLGQARVASPDESARYFLQGDPRWGETQMGGDSPYGKPNILINHNKFTEAGAGADYASKAPLGEALHLYKVKKPDEYNKLFADSMAEPKFAQWMRDSYAHEQARGERREFDDWARHSRFDQVLGGYIFKGDPAFPTMKDWGDHLPFSEAIKRWGQE